MGVISDTSTRTIEFAKSQPKLRLKTAAESYWHSYKALRERCRAVAHLSSLDDRHLKDIGISRCQIENAVKNIHGNQRSS